MIIAVIPAQSESTRLPGKNMKKLLGRPLIDYTIAYAKTCKLIEQIYVSTDSEEIAEYVRQKGVKAIIRPGELCGEASIVEVLQHCLKNIPDSENVSRVVALQVDHPDRKVDLTALLKKATDHDIADVITVDPDGRRNGSVRVLRKKDLMENRISYSIMAVTDECTNIHCQRDFDRAAKNIKSRLQKTNV